MLRSKSILPESKFEVAFATQDVNSCKEIKALMSQVQTLEVDAVFGKKHVAYQIEKEQQYLLMTRESKSLTLIPYPTFRLSFSSQPDQCVVLVTGTLSVVWKAFMYSIYLLLLVASVYEWMHAPTGISKFILIGKIIASFGILQLLLFGYHFSEVKNVKQWLMRQHGAVCKN